MSLAIALPRDNAAGLVTSAQQIARRVLLNFIRTPQYVVVGTLQGAMFLLIFPYVFGVDRGLRPAGNREVHAQLT